jgi:hypothetical protein
LSLLVNRIICFHARPTPKVHIYEFHIYLVPGQDRMV